MLGNDVDFLNSYLAVLLIYGNNFSFFVFIFAGDDLYSIDLINIHGRKEERRVGK